MKRSVLMRPQCKSRPSVATSGCGPLPMVATMVEVGMMRPSVSSTAVPVADLVPTPVSTSMPCICEPLRRVCGEVGGEGRQDAVGIFDQIDADLVGADVRIIFERAA